MKSKKIFIFILSKQTPIIAVVNSKKTKKQKQMDKTLVGTEKSTGALIWRCSVNKVFRKVVQNSQKNTCTGVSF